MRTMIPWKGVLLAVALIQFDGAKCFTLAPLCSKSYVGRKVGSQYVSARSKSALSVPRRPVATQLLGTMERRNLHGAVKRQVKRRGWNLRNLFRRRFSLLKLWLSLRKVLTTTALALFLFFSVLASSASATTGGRMGGSFGQSSSSRSPSPSRTLAPSSSGRYYHSPHRSYGHSRTVVYRDSPTVYFSPRRPVVYQVSPAYVVLTFGVVLCAVAIANSDVFTDFKPRSALGPGVSVASVTVALNVPDRDAPDSILGQLKRFSENARTETRRGVQDLITNVSLQLLRQERSVISAATTYNHYSTASEAQREFNRLSIERRSKFDSETVNKYGGKDMSQKKISPKEIEYLPHATTAVVTISVCIEGDKTRLPQIRSLKSLSSALSRLASDVPVEDCLISGEVLWVPESRTEFLTKEDLFADYPDLVPI